MESAETCTRTVEIAQIVIMAKMEPTKASATFVVLGNQNANVVKGEKEANAPIHRKLERASGIAFLLGVLAQQGQIWRPPEGQRQKLDQAKNENGQRQRKRLEANGMARKVRNKLWLIAGIKWTWKWTMTIVGLALAFWLMARIKMPMIEATRPQVRAAQNAYSFLQRKRIGDGTRTTGPTRTRMNQQDWHGNFRALAGVSRNGQIRKGFLGHCDPG